MTAWQRAYGKSAVWFLWPALSLLALFVVWPLARALYLSLHETDLLATRAGAFTGLSNYSDLLAEPRFRRAFANTALFALLVVPLQATLAFLLALWVTRPEPSSRILQGVFFLPTVVAVPVLAVLWSLIYQPANGSEMGALNTLMVGLGLAPRAWLHDPSLALPAIAAMSIWQGVGLQMMVFVAGIRGLPKDILEAAKIDGANAWQRTLFVTAPALKNSWIFVLSITTILAFRLFVQPYVMTHGGPGNTTLSIAQFIYELTFVGQDLGRACAAAFFLLAWVAFLALLQRRLLHEERA